MGTKEDLKTMRAMGKWSFDMNKKAGYTECTLTKSQCIHEDDIFMLCEDCLVYFDFAFSDEK